MGLRPCGLSGIHDPLPEQELREQVPRAHQVVAAVLARPRQVACGLHRLGGHGHLDDVAHGEHARQEGGVAPVGLHPVARGPEHLGDGADHAWDACLVELPLQVEARGAGLVDASCGLGHALGPFGDLARVIREGLLDYLPGLRDECRSGDGARVYVEPDAGTIEHGWDLLRNVVSRSDNRSLTHDAPQRALVS